MNMLKYLREKNLYDIYGPGESVTGLIEMLCGELQIYGVGGKLLKAVEKSFYHENNGCVEVEAQEGEHF